MGRHRLGLELASHGEGRDGLKGGEGRAPPAGGREVTDADLVAGEREPALGSLSHLEHLHLAEEHVAVEHRHADPGGGSDGGATAADPAASRGRQRRRARRGHPGVSEESGETEGAGAQFRFTPFERQCDASQARARLPLPASAGREPRVLGESGGGRRREGCGTGASVRLYRIFGEEPRVGLDCSV